MTQERLLWFFIKSHAVISYLTAETAIWSSHLDLVRWWLLLFWWILDSFRFLLILFSPLWMISALPHYILWSSFQSVLLFCTWMFQFVFTFGGVALNWFSCLICSFPTFKCDAVYAFISNRPQAMDSFQCNIDVMNHQLQYIFGNNICSLVSLAFWTCP
jgi:hypothetical protein